MAIKPAAANVRNVREPGAPVAQEQTEAQALEAQVADTSGVDLPKADAPEVDLTDPKQLQAYIQAQIKQGVAAGLATHRAAAAPKTKAPELPDQDSIDPNTIDREVLTKQGYVVPTPKALPAHLANLR
jgi:hypothetical protein